MKYTIPFVITALWACTNTSGKYNADGSEDPTEDPVEDPTVDPVEDPQDTSGEGPDTAPDPVEETPCTAYYLDEDRDGYGGQTEACLEAWTEGYVENSDDCCDSVADVNPGQEAFFSESYNCGEADSFDYNCDGTEERVWDIDNHETRHCVSESCYGSGWLPGYPECGETASFGTCELDGRFCIADLDWSGVMRCR